MSKKGWEGYEEVIQFKYTIKEKEFTDMVYYKDIDFKRSSGHYMAVKHHLKDKGIIADNVFAINDIMVKER